MALGLNDRARQLAEKLEGVEGAGPESAARWRRLGAVAAATDADLTRECFRKAKDYGSLILFATTTGKW